MTRISVIFLICSILAIQANAQKKAVPMKGYKAIDVKELPDNVIKLISDDWALITSGDSTKFNTMTASWGGFGNLWNLPVTFIFVKP